MEDFDFDPEEIEEIDDEPIFSDEEEKTLREKIEKSSEMMDRYYAELTKDVLNFILQIREKDPTEPLVQIITQYCFENEIEPELVGDAISQDYYFKQYIENDCKTFPEYCLKQVSSQQIEEW